MAALEKGRIVRELGNEKWYVKKRQERLFKGKGGGLITKRLQLPLKMFHQNHALGKGLPTNIQTSSI